MDNLLLFCITESVIAIGSERKHDRSWDQERLGASRCVWAVVVWGAHFHAVLAERAARLRLRRHAVLATCCALAPSRSHTTAVPSTRLTGRAGWGGANSLVRGG